MQVATSTSDSVVALPTWLDVLEVMCDVTTPASTSGIVTAEFLVGLAAALHAPVWNGLVTCMPPSMNTTTCFHLIRGGRRWWLFRCTCAGACAWGFGLPRRRCCASLQGRAGCGRWRRGEADVGRLLCRVGRGHPSVEIRNSLC
eukprot:357806-Chlamydomonas_euryale.AAC.9